LARVGPLPAQRGSGCCGAADACRAGCGACRPAGGRGPVRLAREGAVPRAVPAPAANIIKHELCKQVRAPVPRLICACAARLIVRALQFYFAHCCKCRR